MKRFNLAALLLLPSLSACGGVGQPNSGAVPQAASARLAPDSAVRETASDSARLPAARFAAGQVYLLYVADAGNNSITVYRANASGNAAPIATIIGSNTQLNNPGQLSEDGNGDLYVANQVNMTPSSILVFAHGANGNVAPIRVIAGPRTGLSANPSTNCNFSPCPIMESAIVDQTDGNLYAVVGFGEFRASKIIRFRPNTSGNQAPYATSAETLGPPNELTFDSSRKNIIEAQAAVGLSVIGAGAYTFTKEFPEGANLASIYSIDDFENDGIADDPTNATYLVSLGYDGVHHGIFRFQEDTVGYGDAQPHQGGGHTPSYSPALVSIITSDTCGTQIALGYERDIYVAHNSNLCRTDAVYVYEHDASGKATPLRVLTGSATELDQPTGIYVGK